MKGSRFEFSSTYFKKKKIQMNFFDYKIAGNQFKPTKVTVNGGISSNWQQEYSWNNPDGFQMEYNFWETDWASVWQKWAFQVHKLTINRAIKPNATVVEKN